MMTEWLIWILIMAWCAIGIVGMVYEWTNDRDLTLGMLLYFCILGPAIGQIVLLVEFMRRHPVMVWRARNPPPPPAARDRFGAPPDRDNTLNGHRPPPKPPTPI